MTPDLVSKCGEVSCSLDQAILLGQLAVFDGYRGHDIGGEILGFVKALFAEPYSPSYEIDYRFNNVGCCYILVDALNKEKVLKIYADNGFQPVYANNDEPEGEQGAPPTKALLFNLERLKV